MSQDNLNTNKYADVPLRVRSWAVIIVIFTAATMHPIVMYSFICFLSFWGMKEFLSLCKLYHKTTAVLIFLFLIPEYFLLFTKNYHAFITYTSLFAVILTALLFFIHKISIKKGLILFTGIFLCGFSVGHLGFIYNFNFPYANLIGIQLLILLVIPTELNDVFQYLTGKAYGKRKITPVISPNKTLEGFLGGIFLTTILCNLLGLVLLHDQSFLLYSLIGILIGVLGFLGDIYMSYVKRDAGVKDTGNLIPGHGGLLDRIDSLMFITPIYFGLLTYLFL
ncbi:phosphatidate cytidylyltransferase [Flavobacterium hungaricum]|uniref:Phosphatidate cytidylyltransferase n=1 Tax=Flavobacterium hungaricum TaxID=2082725 RepID=A0ABR9TRF0_9FLAO|nr:phosphatidate cytidylyltransferase [Flavobacterium hungaricum]MBE8727906.1 phosphatidate cytidylyltransferase [Flavobacterium hungaricum]